MVFRKCEFEVGVSTKCFRFWKYKVTYWKYNVLLGRFCLDLSYSGLLLVFVVGTNRTASGHAISRKDIIR